MSDNTYTKIFSGSFIIVQLALDRLKGAGINAIIKDESESGRLAGFGGTIYGLQDIYVHKDELEKTTAIIESLNLELEP